VKTHTLIIALMLLLSGSGLARAEDPILDYPLRPTDLSSPAATIDSLRYWAEQIYRLSSAPAGRETHERLLICESHFMSCLDLSQQPEYAMQYAGREAGLSIKEILDRLDLSAVNIPRLGTDTNGIPTSSALPSSWTVPNTELVLVREDREGREPLFRFSVETVAGAFDYYTRIDHLPLIDESTPGILNRYLYQPSNPTLARLVRTAPRFFLFPLWRHALWQWLALVVSFGVAVALVVVFVRIGRRHDLHVHLAGRLKPAQGLLGPLCVMFGALFLRSFVSTSLGFRGLVAELSGFTTGLVTLVALATLIVILGGRLAGLITATSSRMGSKVDDQFVHLVCRLASFVVAALVFVEGGKGMGIPLSTLLAGAGIGGLAVALSAQDALKNIIGGVLINLDKPLALGDHVTVGGFTGIVKNVGLRSTRLVDFSGHEITIPNDVVATSSVENVGRRGSIRRLTDLALPLDITREKAELAAELVRGVLKDHEGMDPEQPPHVFLCDLERDCLVLRFLCYYTPPDYMQYLAFCSRTNLAIMAAFEKHGIRMALPSSETIVAGRNGAPAIQTAQKNHE
jgi:MscS family membrane protein